MKIKLKDKPTPKLHRWKFMSVKGEYDKSIIDDLNSGKSVEVKKVPTGAWRYIEEVKTKTKKEGK
tara:strand:- start:1073 stop:1267 length:195 start_codon:yes stop_codon:yes gene_type:complete